MAKLRVGVVFGGRSVEHEVSVISATSIVGALDPARYDVTLLAVDTDGRWRLGAPGSLPETAGRGDEVWLPAVPGDGTLQHATRGDTAAQLDVILPIIHGTGGEDGCLQGFLELAGVPYVGSGVLGSALQMDKEVSKRLLHAAGVPVVPWLLVRGAEIRNDLDAAIERSAERFDFPVFVKPACLGSSVGIARAADRDALRAALLDAARYDDKVLVERAVDAREIEVGVIGNDLPEASVPGEIVPKRDFYDYEAKYVDEATELAIPAPVTPEQSVRLRELAILAFRVLEGRGLARVDFFLDRQDDAIYVSEVNSLPGFTEVSMFPRLWMATGLPYPALLDRLIELALEQAGRRTQLVRTYST